jgi:hypothetical protein
MIACEKNQCTDLAVGCAISSWWNTITTARITLSTQSCSPTFDGKYQTIGKLGYKTINDYFVERQFFCLVFHEENSSKNRIFSARKGYIRIKHGIPTIPNARGGVPSGKGRIFLSLFVIDCLL